MPSHVNWVLLLAKLLNSHPDVVHVFSLSNKGDLQASTHP